MNPIEILNRGSEVGLFWPIGGSSVRVDLFADGDGFVQVDLLATPGRRKGSAEPTSWISGLFAIFCG
jgi:hypothetical protein